MEINQVVNQELYFSQDVQLILDYCNSGDLQDRVCVCLNLHALFQIISQTASRVFLSAYIFDGF